MYWTLVKTGLIRKRLRTFLTIMSMFIAFVLYGSLNALSGMFTGTIDGLEADNIIVMPRYDFFTGKLPISHVNFIETLEGVEAVMHADYLLSDSIESLMDGVTFAASPNFFDVYTRLQTTEEAKLALINNPNATIVGQLMADQKGLKVGDRLNTKSNYTNSDGTNDWSFEIVGFYKAEKITGIIAPKKSIAKTSALKIFIPSIPVKVTYAANKASDADLLGRYREMSIHPECDSAINDIVNEAIAGDLDNHPVDLELSNLPVSDNLKRVIRDEFSNILSLLDFDRKAHEIFRNWYIDGKLCYLKVIDMKKPQEGIQELRYIDSLKIRFIRQEKKKTKTQQFANDINNRNDEGSVSYTHLTLPTKA
mgnify:CR=1 FL=1